MAFQITAELILKGPSNVASVVNSIQSQLKSIDPSIQVKVNSTGLKDLTTQLNSTKAAVDTTNKSISEMGGFALKNAPAIRQLDEGLKRVASSSEIFANQMGLAGRRFLAFVVAGGAIVRLIQGFKEGVSQAVAFDREMVRLAQVSSESALQLRGVENEISRLSTSLGVSSSELSKAAVTFKQAGYTINETKNALEAIAEAALAPNFDSMAQTMEGAIAVLRQFKLQSTELKGALGSINAVAADFAVEAGDIIEAVKKSGGAFSSLGGDLNQFIALFTSVRATTREGAGEIATGLRTIFSRLQRNDTVESLKQLGIELRRTRSEAELLGDVNLEDQFVGAYEAIGRLSEALSKIRTTDSRYGAIIEELGGFRQVGKVIPLIQQYGEAQKALITAQSGQISTTIAAEKAQGALAVQTQKVKEEYLALFRGIVQSDPFKSLAESAFAFASNVAKILDYAKPLLPILLTIAGIKLTQNIASFLGAYTTTGNNIAAFIQGASGKGAKRLASGGRVPGMGNTDSVHALLTPGEFVINKDAAAQIGPANLQMLNRSGAATARYAGGGSVIKTPEQLKFEKLIELLGGGDKGAVKYSNLIDKITNKYSGVNLEGLGGIQDIAHQGLLKATESFDPSAVSQKTGEPVKFSSYGYSTAIQSVQNAIKSLNAESRGGIGFKQAKENARILREGKEEEVARLLRNSTKPTFSINDVDAPKSTGIEDSTFSSVEKEAIVNETNQKIAADRKARAIKDAVKKEAAKVTASDRLAKVIPQVVPPPVVDKSGVLGQLSGLGVNVEAGAAQKLSLSTLQGLVGIHSQVPESYRNIIQKAGKTQTIVDQDVIKTITGQRGLGLANASNYPGGSVVGLKGANLDVLGKNIAGSTSVHEIGHVVDVLLGGKDRLSSQNAYQKLHSIVSKSIQASPGNIGDLQLKQIAAKPTESFAQGFSTYYSNVRGILPQNVQDYYAALEAGGGKLPDNFGATTPLRTFTGFPPAGSSGGGRPPRIPPIATGAPFPGGGFGGFSNYAQRFPQAGFGGFSAYNQNLLQQQANERFFGDIKNIPTYGGKLGVGIPGLSQLPSDAAGGLGFPKKSYAQIRAERDAYAASPADKLAIKQQILDQARSGDVLGAQKRLVQEFQFKGNFSESEHNALQARIQANKPAAPPVRPGIGSRINNAFETRGGRAAQTGFLIAAPLIANQVEKLGGTAEEAALTNGRAYGAAKAAGGALQGAAVGSLIGSVIPGVGTGVGALAGAIVGGIQGVISGLKEAETEIRQVKIGNAITSLADKLQAFAAAGRDISPEALSSSFDLLKTYTTEAGEKAKDQSTHTFTGFNADEYTLFKQKNLRTDLGGQLPQITQGLVRQIDQAARANTQATPEQLVGNVKNGLGGLNSELIKIVASIRGVSVSQVLKEFAEQAKSSLRIAKTEAAKEQARPDEERNLNAFQRLVDSIQAAADSLSTLKNQSQALSDSFEGVVGGSKVSFSAQNLNRFGYEDSLNPLRTIAAVGGQQGQQLLGAGQRANQVASILPEILVSALKQNPLSEEGLITNVGRNLRERTGNPRGNDVINSVLSSLAQKQGEKPGELYKGIGTDVSKFSEDLLKTFTDPIKDSGIKAAQLLEQEANTFVQGLAQISQKAAAVGTEFDKLSNIQVSRLRINAEIEAKREGNPSGALDKLSVQQLQAGLTFRQERLTGNRGIGENPQAIGNRLGTVQDELLKAVENQNKVASATGGAGKEYEGAARKVIDLQREAANLQNALRNLADIAERNAVIQEKLNRIGEDRQSRINFGERLLRGGPEARGEAERGLILANQANNLQLGGQGGLKNFTDEQIDNLLGTLRGLGNAKLTGFQGQPRANDLADRLIQGLGGIFEIDAQSRAEEKQLEEQKKANAAAAEAAQKELAEKQARVPDRLLQILQTQHEQFFTRLEALFAKNTLSAKQIELGAAQKNLNDLNKTGTTIDTFSKVGITNSNQVRTALNVKDRIKEYIDNNYLASEQYSISGQFGTTGKKLATPFQIGFGENRSLISSGPRSFKLSERGEEQASAFLDSISDKITPEQKAAILKNFGQKVKDNADNQKYTGTGIGKIYTPVRSDEERANLLKDDLLAAAREELTGGAKIGAINARLRASSISIKDANLKPEELGKLGTSPESGKNFIEALAKFDPANAAIKLEDFSDKLIKAKDAVKLLEDEVNKLKDIIKAGEDAKPKPVDVTKVGAAIGFLASGGYARGTDTVPAMLTPGEFIVNRNAAQANAGLLNEINSGVQYYADGGQVPDWMKRNIRENQILDEYESERLARIEGKGNYNPDATGNVSGDLLNGRLLPKGSLESLHRMGTIGSNAFGNDIPNNGRKFPLPPAPDIKYGPNIFNKRERKLLSPLDAELKLNSDINTLSGPQNLLYRQLIANSSGDESQKSIGIGILQHQQERNDLRNRQNNIGGRYLPVDKQEDYTKQFTRFNTQRKSSGGIVRHYAEGGQVQGAGGDFSGFVNAAQQLSGGLTSFATVAGPLAEALKNFPSQLTITGNQSIAVTFNGAEVLASIQGDLRDMAANMIKSQLQTLFKNQLPDAGINVE